MALLGHPRYMLPHVTHSIGHMPLQQLMLVISTVYFNMQEQGFSLCSTSQRPLHRIERERKMALIEREIK
jgi:hypothetical protein